MLLVLLLAKFVKQHNRVNAQTDDDQIVDILTS